MKLQGTYIQCGMVSSDGTFTQFAYAKNCSVDMDRDMQEVSSPDTGDSKEYIPMRMGWNMSISCLMSDDETTVWNAYKNGTKITVSWRDTTSGATNREWTGSAYIKSLKAAAQIHEMATFAITLQGTGALTYQEV